MKYKFWITFIIPVILPFISYAQKDSSLTLSLKEAQDYAINQNLTLENVRLDIDKAEKRVWETTAIGLPQATGNVDYQHIPGKIPTFPFTDDNGDPLDIPLAVKNSTTYGVTVSQLVFSGEYIIGLQAAKAYLQISKLSYVKGEIDLRANVLTNYVSILILEDNLKTISSSVENLESLVKETNALSEQGFLESTDADQLQVNLNTLINAKKTIERQTSIAYSYFKIVLGVDLNQNLVLTEDLETIYNQIVEKDNSEGFDVSNNIDYKIMNNQVMLNKLLYKREQSKYLPTISAFYNYQDKTEKASFDVTINHIIGVNASIPIFTSFQRNAMIQQAKIEHSKSINDRTLVEQNLTTQTQQLRYDFYNNLEKYQISVQNVELSKKIFENTTIKYKQGMTSSMDLTQSNNTYLQAETDKINALYELIQTKIELEKILNEL